MVVVQLRNAGSGLWTPLTLPTSTQVAHTLVTAVKTLDIADEVRVQATAAPGKLDVKA
ncbi:MAG TPA: hypothetical protein VF474_03090 [Phenylobacterium sp.]